MSPGIELLASGFGLIEGPTADGVGGLYFSDVVNGGVFHLDADGVVTTAVPKRRGVGGIALHADGGIVVSGRDVAHVRDGETRVLFGLDDGVLGWNDLGTDRAGRVYAGTLRFRPLSDDEPVPGELWRIDAPGRATALYGDVLLSNGVALSADENVVFHADTRRGVIHVHEVRDDGSVVRRPPIDTVSVGRPDGLALDREGCLWVAMVGAGCVARWTPVGTLDRRVEVPARTVTSCCFAEGDDPTLYVVSADHTAEPSRAGSVFRLSVGVGGAPVWPARI